MSLRMLLTVLWIVRGRAAALASQRVPTKRRRAARPANPSELPPDLGTRRDGEDWPAFLGPTADSKSLERGILTEWGKKHAADRLAASPRHGLRHADRSAAAGCFSFRASAIRHALECLKSETGEPLWKFEYPTDYEDLYGYDNGPRCSPVVDEDRVYIFGAEGMLHCLRDYRRRAAVEDRHPRRNSAWCKISSASAARR